jgi:hypothetical protein
MELTVQYFTTCPNWMPLIERLYELTVSRPDVRILLEAVESAEQAERLGFLGSPTVLAPGRAGGSALAVAAGRAPASVRRAALPWAHRGGRRPAAR